MKTITPDLLLSCIGDIDPAFIENAERKVKPKLQTTKNSPFRIRRFVPIAACAVIALAMVFILPNINNSPQPMPTDATENAIPTPADGGEMPTEAIKPATEDGSASLDIGAVYHDVDLSQISNHWTPGSVPFGFFFQDRLSDYANNETGINLNNGVRWGSGQFEIEDVANFLQTSVNAPALPDGDYTIDQKIMIDEATGKTIAYQTVYTYFTVETMEFQRSFSVFYFSLDDFRKRDAAFGGNLEQSENIVGENGKVVIHDFPLPPVVANTGMRIPQKRELVYSNNGIGIVIEAITAPIVIYDDTVDETKSLERYEQSDKEIIRMMMSLVS